MPPIFVEGPPSNGGALLVDGQYHSGRVQMIWWIPLGWRGSWNVNLIHNWCDGWFDHFFELFWDLHHFIIRLLPVEFNCGLHDDGLFIRLVIHTVASFWNLDAWGTKISITEVVEYLWFGIIWRRWELMGKQPGEISVFRTWFELRKFGRLGIGFRKESSTKTQDAVAIK